MIDDVRRIVAERANWRCEYCKLPAAASPAIAFHVDHIRARQHGGSRSLDNACYCCWRCNLHKGTNQSAFDPQTDELVRLFHPRTDTWEDHFQLGGPMIIGRTAVGRATVALLQMNDSLRVELREATSGDFPEES